MLAAEQPVSAKASAKRRDPSAGVRLGGSLKVITVVAVAVALVAGATVAHSVLTASAAADRRPLHHLSSLASMTVAQPPPDPTPSTPGTEVDSGEKESDPVVYTDGNRYYLYTSGSPPGSIANVPVSTSTDFTSWTPVTDALPVLPPWVVPGFTWAPDVHEFGSTYVLYYTAAVKGTSEQCIGSSVSRSPIGPFTAGSAPFICQRALGGSIDPRVFTDGDGTNWMVWKSDQNIGGRSTPTILWSQRLSPNGLALIGARAELMGPDEPWQGTIVEAPDMVEVAGVYWVFYSGNWFNQPAYAIGAARCKGPAGPCSDDSNVPLLATNAQGDGPGEGSVFLDRSGAWLLYTPERATGRNPPRPVDITRIGFATTGPYLAAGGPPPSVNALSGPELWSGP